MDEKIFNWMGTAKNSFLCCPITLPCDRLNYYSSHQYDRPAYCIHPITGCVSLSIENALDGFSDGAASVTGWMRRVMRPPRRASVCPHPERSIWCEFLPFRHYRASSVVCSWCGELLTFGPDGSSELQLMKQVLQEQGSKWLG